MGAKLAAGLAAASLGLFGLWGVRRAMSPKGLDAVRPLPEFKMTAVTAKGEISLSKSDLQGRPWVADFIFTSCGGPCPMLSAEMAGLQKELPKDIRLVTFTVDPDRDTSRALRRYAAAFGADPGRWLFVTGDKGALYKLMYEGFNLPIVEDRQAPSGFKVTHSAKFVLVDSRGVVRGYYGREGARSLEQLKADAARLLKGES